MKKSLYDMFAERWAHNDCGVFFYSDPHFGDPEMRLIRTNYVEDSVQVARINRVVRPQDTLILLGDIGDVEWVKKLRGYKVLIMGNHDKGASNYVRKLELLPDEDDEDELDLYFFRGEDNHLFDEVYEGALMISPKIILSHEPIPNLPEWLFNIHGHDHSNWFTGSRHLNVCAEHINYTPVSLASIVKSGVLKDVTNIHQDTINRRKEELKNGNRTPTIK